MFSHARTDLDGRVSISEGGGGELVLDGGVLPVGVRGRVGGLGDDDAVARHDVAAEEAREEVAVHDVLVLAHEDAPTFLVAWESEPTISQRTNETQHFSHDT